MKRAWMLIFVGVLSAGLQAAQIKVESPQAGESLVLGVAKPVVWTYSGMPASAKVTIILRQGSVKIGVVAQDIAVGAGGQGSFSWTAGSYLGGTAPAGTGYALRIRSADNSVAALSGSFSLVEKSQGGGQVLPPKTFPGQLSGPAAELAFTAPKPGDQVDPYNSFKVTWTRRGTQDANVSIVLLRQGKNLPFRGVTLAASAPNSGTFVWDPLDPMPAPGPYKLKIRTLDGKCEALSGEFAIREVGGIELLSPKGGEVWESGTPHAVSWKRLGNIRTLDIALSRNGAVPTVLAQGINAALGSAAVTPVRDAYDGNNPHCYTIQIKHSGGNYVAPSGCITLTGNPDLAASASFSLAMPAIGSDVTFTVKIENKGAVRSQPCQGVLKANGVVQKTFAVPAIDSGASATVTVIWKLSCPATVTITVDSGGANIEPDKANNTWTKTIC